MTEEKQFIITYDLQFFAKEGPGGEKTEEPTGKKISDARKKGQVAKSREISIAVELLAFFIMLRIYVDNIGFRFERFFQNVYGQIPEIIKMYNGEVPVSAIQTPPSSAKKSVQPHEKLLFDLQFLFSGFHQFLSTAPLEA